MSIGEYVKDKGIPIFIVVITCLLTLSFMFIMEIYLPIAVMIEIIYCAGFGVMGIYDFVRKKQYYDHLKEARQDLEASTYLAEIIERPDFYDGRIMYDIVRENGKYLNDVITDQQAELIEYKNYVETWAHEIKTPIAVAKLTIENNRNRVTADIEEELERIEGHVEQMIYYAKSNSLAEDYHIQEVSLKALIIGCLQKNAKMMIGKKVAPKMENLDFQILTDPKWADFMISQVLSNAVKYLSQKRRPQILILAEEEHAYIKLQICDNGIGIPQRDINRVFKKGFTGENGRVYQKSTGMGLFLCKSMCEKMGIDLWLESEKEQGTQVFFRFSKA